VWLLRDEVDETFNVILEKLLSLSYSTISKVLYTENIGTTRAQTYCFNRLKKIF